MRPVAGVPAGADGHGGRYDGSVRSSLAAVLAAALRDAGESSTTGGGWPEELSAARQDAWVLLVELEASLVGLVGSQLAGGRVEPERVHEVARRLEEPVLLAWPAEEVARWRRVATLLSLP